MVWTQVDQFVYNFWRVHHLDCKLEFFLNNMSYFVCGPPLGVSIYTFDCFHIINATPLSLPSFLLANNTVCGATSIGSGKRLAGQRPQNHKYNKRLLFSILAQHPSLQGPCRIPAENTVENCCFQQNTICRGQRGAIN